MTENLTENLTAALVMTGNNFSLILTEDFDSCAGSPISLTTKVHKCTTIMVLTGKFR